MTEISSTLNSFSYTIKSASSNTNIFFSDGGVLEKLGATLKDFHIGEQVAIITSPNIRRLHVKKLEKLESSLKGAGFEHIIIEISDDEEDKSLTQYSNVIDKLVSFCNEKSTFIVTLGGGVVGDIGGFVAATFKRGIPWVDVPTTLLAQVDCAIGGKVGVNHTGAKNYIGTFYQPSAVLEDLSLLRTLSKVEIQSGLSEIVKYGLGFDRDLFEYIENHVPDILALEKQAIQHVIKKSCEIKAGIVECDVRDEGIRQKLNLGHTIGHALEKATNYSVYTHGEAISIGMVCACDIASRLKLINPATGERVEKLLIAIGLPVAMSSISIEDIMEALSRDKKFRGETKFILPVCIGESKIETGIQHSLIKDVIEKRMLSRVRGVTGRRQLSVASV